MKVASTRDWSGGLNSVSPDSLSHAKLLSELGSSLRAVYGNVDAQLLPQHLAMYIDRLEERDRAESQEG